jgi:uncharacterized membrane protein
VQVQLELALRLSSYVLAVSLGVILIALSLVSMWKETHQGQSLREIISLSLAIIALFAAIALLAGYLQKAKSMEKTSHRIEVMKLGSAKSAASALPFQS